VFGLEDAEGEGEGGREVEVLVGLELPPYDAAVICQGVEEEVVRGGGGGGITFFVKAAEEVR
jgi:hypothetical protein